MKRASKDKELESHEALPVPAELLDSFVVSIIDALKKAKEHGSIAEVKDVLITTDLRELLLFVGIVSKQCGTKAQFAWESYLKLGKGGFDEK